ncbi:MAG: DUF4350 domain-containing protein [Ferruginibacter sp.]
MNKNIAYILCCCLLLYGCKLKSHLPDLRETYSSSDTKPFGGFIAKNILRNSFPDNYVQTVKEPFEKTAAIFDDTASVYFSVSQNLFIEDRDIESLLDFVYKGNTAFFASANFDTLLLNKIFCKIPVQDPFVEVLPDYRQTAVSLIQEISGYRDSFSYYYRPFESYFSEVNDRYGRVIGYNAEGKTNCIVFFWGKGKLFLHTDPRAFSNYFLLKNDNYKYMQRLTQVMGSHPQHVYWNEYYLKLKHRKNSDGNGSSLGEIFKYPPLQTAFWLLLLMLLLFILFGGKRRQRIIKEKKANQNSSVAFTETIARLYLQQHDNKNIADKMITYFHEFIRNNYYINTTAANKDFITALSRKSGVSEEKTIALFNTINHANQNSVIDDYQLLSLNEQIQQFYKKRK